MSMYIRVITNYGEVEFGAASYEKFKDLHTGGMKINAIKMIREMVPSMGLKEAKDFVEDCYFPPASTTTPTKVSKEDTTFLCEVKDDLRTVLVTETQYRESLLIDLFGRVCAKVGLR